MTDGNPMAAEVLEVSAAGFASAADAHLQRSRPDVARGSSTGWRAYFRQRVLEISAAVRVGDPLLFVRRIDWLRRAAHARSGDDTNVELPLRSLDAVLREEAPAALQGSITAVLDAALESLQRPLEPEPGALGGGDPFARLALQYISTCLDGDARGAATALLAAVDGGTSVQDVYCRVLMPAQKEVGRLWHRGDLNVAEERLVSETTRRVMAQLAARQEPATSAGPKVLAAAVAGNAHDLGLRAAADLFSLAGWRCFYLGANVPATDIALLVEAHRIDLVLLAATLETQLGATAEAIAEIKRVAPSCKTLVGGIALDDTKAVLRELGADEYCSRLDDVVALGTQLLGAARR